MSIERQVYSVTTVTANRESVFQSFELGWKVVSEMRKLHEEGYVESLAYVVMPDHLHWMFQLCEKESLSQLMKRLKGRSAMAIVKATGRKGSIWQKGFHDHGIRKEEDLKTLARYIIANPLRAGLVNQIGDYPLWDAVWIVSDNSEL
ncbi:MAG: transposase [Candidatus Sedimenticola sp. 20ELBAFRAG]